MRARTAADSKANMIRIYDCGSRGVHTIICRLLRGLVCIKLIAQARDQESPKTASTYVVICIVDPQYLQTLLIV